MTVHPRLRGELCLSGSESIRSTGSSPLTRGTLSSELYTIVKTRFIPAYAGNSAELVGVQISHTVHPRLRGELKGSNRWRIFPHGSSPLTRGTLNFKSSNTG